MAVKSIAASRFCLIGFPNRIDYRKFELFSWAASKNKLRKSNEKNANEVNWIIKQAREIEENGKCRNEKIAYRFEKLWCFYTWSVALFIWRLRSIACVCENKNTHCFGGKKSWHIFLSWVHRRGIVITASIQYITYNFYV